MNSQTNSPTEVLRAWEAAYNARDAHALVALYHEEAENTQVALNETLRGHEELLESFLAFFAAFPDNTTHIENLLNDGEWVSIEWFGTGTFLGKLGSMEPTGKSFTLRGSGFFRVVEGKIVYQRGYFDKESWFSQML